MKYAVIDLSSTGVSMIIAAGDEKNGAIETVYKDRTNIAITEYFEGRRISPRGIERLIDALIAARSTAKAMGAELCYVISTAALRNVDNIDDVAERIRMRTGLVVNRLDGKTEAYCDLTSNRRYAAYDKAVLIDIGGGSVELCDLSDDGKNEIACLEFGPLKLRDEFVADVFPTEDEAKEIRKFVRKKADEAAFLRRGDVTTAVLVGSINGAICSAFREYCDSNRLSSELTYDKYKKFTDALVSSPDRMRLILKVAPEKIHVLPVASLILREMLKRFKPDEIVVSECGVKEGYLALVLKGEQKGEATELNATV